MTIFINLTLFSPDHFVDYAGIGLDEFDDFGGDIGVDVVGNR